MTLRRWLATITIYLNGVCACLAQDRAEDPRGISAGAPLTTVAEIRAQRGVSSSTDRPLSLAGIVTLVDPERNMVVLQDETGAVALHGDSPVEPVQAGQRVSLKARGTAAFVATSPGYPFAPSAREVRSSFEAPENEGDFLLNRMRGWLRPTETGNYTFWISSDDSSELWLSPGAESAEARRVATVPTGQWTDRREWTRYPSQRSETVFLRAGEPYFIEALQEQLLSACHLAVAWEGPNLERAVIDGRHLVPWEAGIEGLVAENKAGGSKGILWERWTGFSVGNLGPIKEGRWSDGKVAVSGMEITVLESGVWPEPLEMDLREGLSQNDTFRWVEGEGAVAFLASGDGSLNLEIAAGPNRVLVRVARWQGPVPQPGPRLRAKFKGVCEGAHDLTGHLLPGSIWAPSENEAEFYEDSDGSPRSPADASAAPVSDAALGGYFFTRGVVTFSDRVLGKDCLFVQEASGGIFISQEDRQFQPPPQVGQWVEVGGNFLPRRYAPAIRPLALNILGWQRLPAPVISAGEASLRDGQWTEIEGVARSVSADGRMILSGRQSAVAVWIGRTNPEDVGNLVNCRIRVRGAISLDTFDTPLLLVPSREFVEISNPAPTLPDEPTSVSSLQGVVSGSGWVHQVKVAGTVTYQNNDIFYLQDPSGGVRVEAVNMPPLGIGSVVEVVGFPSMDGAASRLTDAACRVVAKDMPIAATPMDLENPDPANNGMLVSIDARVLSQKTRDAETILELQSARHVFLAVMDSAGETLPEYSEGSLLALTGVGLLDMASSPVALRQVLLRGPQDVTFLKGPPWWTWKRTAILIGALVAVLAGSLLRIQFLSRRFARQQAARLAFARGILESQESERRRIAASLHDSLGQDLLVIRNQAHMAIQSTAEKSDLRQRLEEISTTTLLAINEVREITHNLRPYQLDRLGLSQSIRAITRKVSENCPITFASHVDEIDGMFDKDSEIHIYRIVQEGINNVLKHSSASEAAVVVRAVGGGLSISIRDNGKGFADHGGPPEAAFGLSGIRERAGILGGTARIDSSPGKGVNLQVHLPLQTPSKCEIESKS